MTETTSIHNKCYNGNIYYTCSTANLSLLFDQLWLGAQVRQLQHLDFDSHYDLGEAAVLLRRHLSKMLHLKVAMSQGCTKDSAMRTRLLRAHNITTSTKGTIGPGRRPLAYLLCH